MNNQCLRTQHVLIRKNVSKNMFSLAAQATSLSKIGQVTILMVYSTKS